MSDLEKAVAAAREHRAAYVADEPNDCGGALGDLLAALDAARGEAVKSELRFKSATRDWSPWAEDGDVDGWASELRGFGMDVEVRHLYAAPPAALAVPAPPQGPVSKRTDYVEGYDEGWNACLANAARQAQQPAAVPDALRAGNLPTMNQDEYPGLGAWWVNVRSGEDVVYRAYGNTPQEAMQRAQALATQAQRRAAAAPADECPACGKNWGEHRLGYSASSCKQKPAAAPKLREFAIRSERREDGGFYVLVGPYDHPRPHGEATAAIRAVLAASNKENNNG